MTNLPEIINSLQKEAGESLFKGGLFNSDRKITAQENVFLSLVDAKKQIELAQIESDTSLALSKLDIQKAGILQQAMKEKNIQAVIKLKQEALSVITQLANSDSDLSDDLIIAILSYTNINLPIDDDSNIII